MRTLKLTIAYDGTRYAGWQIQPARATVQGVLQRALRRILQERVYVIGSGRTDAGVHALAQAAHIKTRSDMPVGRLRRALSGTLPPDIAVTAITEVSPRFQAQFHAKRKRYRYQIVNGPVVLPFERLYVHQVQAPLNVALMRREAAVLRGRHDFRAFCAAGSSVTDTRRTISRLQVRRQRGRITIDVEADGFLYNMVRGIAGTLIDIGRGRLSAGTMRRILRTKDRRLLGQSAPGRGLMLMAVVY